MGRFYSQMWARLYSFITIPFHLKRPVISTKGEKWSMTKISSLKRTVLSPVEREMPLSMTFASEGLHHRGHQGWSFCRRVTSARLARWEGHFPVWHRQHCHHHHSYSLDACWCQVWPAWARMACPVWPPGAVLPGIPEPASIGSLGLGATSTEGPDPGPELPF